MYHARAPIESISKILDRENIVTAPKYLGINFDDIQAAMDLYENIPERVSNVYDPFPIRERGPFSSSMSI